ncbi:MAG: hypothetical protein IT349_18585 [Candidatus Eisenbacteria bacterium]|nr:hypothetical protein [Candidatus Eisenbacteria bacterium]
MPAIRGFVQLNLSVCLLLIGSAFHAGLARGQEAGTWRSFLYGNEVLDLAADGATIYAATTGGLVRFDPVAGMEQWTRSPGGLLSDTLGVVAVSPSTGRVWLGTARAGISVFDPENESFLPYTSLLEPIPGDRIRAIRFDSVVEQGTTRERMLVGAEQGYALFADGDLREVCFQGVDLCNLASFDVRDLVRRTNGGSTSLWIGTASGVLEQLSGGAWENRSSGLVSRDVTRLLEDHCIAGGQIYRWDGAQWQADATGLPQDQIARDLATGPGGELYLGGSRGVFGRGEAGWTRVGTNAFPATSVVVTAGGRLFAGAADPSETQDGIWEWTGAAWVQHRLEGPSLRQHYRSVKITPDGTVWLSHAESGTRPQVIQVRRGTWSFWNGGLTGCSGAWTWNTILAGDHVYLAHCCCGTVDACPLERISVASNDCQVIEGVPNAWDFDLDDDGNLWVASWSESQGPARGIFRLDARDSTWINLTPANTPEMKSTQITAIRRQGNDVWIGYNASGLHRLTLGADKLPGTADDTWTWYRNADPQRRLIGDEVRRIEVAPDGRVWIGTTAGLSIWAPGRITNIGPGFGRLPSAQVNAIVPTEDGGGWVATRDEGVTRLTPAEFGFDYEVFAAPYLPHPNVEAMSLSPDGRTLWLGTARGLASFTPSSAGSGGSTSLSAYPNPFVLGCSDGVRVLGLAGGATGVVVDLSGKVLHRIDAAEGDELLWDGRSDGAAVPPGLYWMRLRTARGVESVGVGVMDGVCP